jgi:hypothetical protein
MTIVMILFAKVVICSAIFAVFSLMFKKVKGG